MILPYLTAFKNIFINPHINWVDSQSNNIYNYCHLWIEDKYNYHGFWRKCFKCKTCKIIAYQYILGENYAEFITNHIKFFATKNNTHYCISNDFVGLTCNEIVVKNILS